MRYANGLPQLEGGVFLTDGGIETDLIFNRRFELPEFAAFHLLESAEGREGLRAYFLDHARVAVEHGTGFIFESPTWRANPDWGWRLGYDAQGLRAKNREAVYLMHYLRDQLEEPQSPMVVSGCVGPRGDGYIPGERMSAAGALRYHAEQIGALRKAEVDMITAITMNYVEEAMGVVLAARSAGLPSVISFTVETDGRLPSGDTLGEAIAVVDEATAGGPAYYMINCAHPTHFSHVLLAGGDWVERVRGIRANASKCSHAELDEAPELDAGDPAELGREFQQLTSSLGQINVLGGCCGTDHRHIAEIARACLVVSV
ncbi:MAG: homocysteine S-methyltransferase [Gemmatimonadetes bacterium]|nr:homocysteine S-methyltransferase [Gemmatimonadota bacterium]